MKKIGKYLLVLLTMFTLVTPYASALEEDSINENKVVLTAKKDNKAEKEEKKAEKEKEKEEKKAEKEKEKEEKKDNKEEEKTEQPVGPVLPPVVPGQPPVVPGQPPVGPVLPPVLPPKPPIGPGQEEKKVTITVNYVDNNNKTIETSTKQEVKVGNTYKVEAKEISGYMLKSESATVEDTAKENTEVTFVYHPVADLFIRIDATIQYEDGTTGYPESEYLYVGTTTATGKKVYDKNADKTTDLSALLNLSEKVENEVTTEITDKEVIAYLNTTYKADLQEDDDIVWYVLKEQKTSKKTVSYKDSEGKTVKVEVPECLYHIDGVVYKKGKVTTNYVDEDGNKLTASKVDTYYYGENYTTTAKSFDDYELIETKGTESAKVNTRETTVTYVYQFVMGQGDDEPTEDPIEEPIETPVEEEKELVQTGSEIDYSMMTSAFITASLMVLAFKTKRKNN